MAFPTAGITATWNSQPLGEISEIRWVYGGGLPQSRGATGTTHVPWSMDLGTIEISSFGTALGGLTNFGANNTYGRKYVLAIGGTHRVASATATIVTINLTTKAICQTLDLGAKVNEAWQTKGTFKIVLE